MRLTHLEWKIIRNRIGTLLVWSVFLLFCVGSFVVHWILGLFAVLLGTPFFALFCCKNARFYFPKDGYFRKCSKFTKEERIRISNQCEQLGKYPHLGELVALDDYLVFTRFGVLLNYRDIQNISYKRYTGYMGTPEHSYEVIVQTCDSKKYLMWIMNDIAPFLDETGMYYQLSKWISSHKAI